MGINIQSEPRSERLSALMDGEVSDSEIGHALLDLKQDHELTHRWDRYHLASDALRNNLGAAVDPSLANRISAAIEAEPVYLGAHRRRRAAGVSSMPDWVRQTGGLALAASVTAMVILGTQALTNKGTQSTPQLAAMTQPATPVGTNPAGINSLLRSSTPPDGIELVAQRGDDNAVTFPQSKFNRLLLSHQEYQADNTLQGVLPYVRLVYTQP